MATTPSPSHAEAGDDTLNGSDDTLIYDAGDTLEIDGGGFTASGTSAADGETCDV